MINHTILLVSLFAFVGSATLFQLVSLERDKKLRDVWITFLLVAIVSFSGFVYGTWQVAAGFLDIATSIVALLVCLVISFNFVCYRSTTLLRDLERRIAQNDREIQLREHFLALAEHQRYLLERITKREE